MDWFDHFLKIGLAPLMYVYHKYGMAFESHQQNVLLELEDGLPKNLWLRDNQGFYYIEEFATEIVEALPDLLEKLMRLVLKILWMNALVIISLATLYLV